MVPSPEAGRRSRRELDLVPGSCLGRHELALAHPDPAAPETQRQL